MKTTTQFIALFLLLACVSFRASAQVVLEPVLSNLASPVYLTNARDGSNRLFVLEQAGRIQVLQPNAAAPTVFLDITTRVLSGGERGLLGLAFHPQFRANRRFFVNYTRQPDGATVIAEYRVSAGNPNVADVSETVLLVIPQPFPNHNGGMIEFGPDGLLYIGMGDGGSANDPGNRAQNVEELLGKMLRINVDQANGSVPYSSPSDNPFFGATAGRDEIYATGLRNPFRFSFDRATGQLYAGDVGQGEREEIDIITRGGNYGWRVFEGTRCTGLGPAECIAANFQAPVAEYDTRAGGRCSVIGGYVYRGTRATVPAGAYVFGDFCSGEIFLLQNGAQSLLQDTNLSISSFGEDEAGELYVVSLGGTVHRLTTTCSYSITPATQSFNGGGGTGTVTISTTSNCSWTAVSNAAWLRVTAGASGTGNGTVTFSVEANGGPARTGTLSVAGQTFTVTQGSGCLYAVNPPGLSTFPAGGGQGTFNITTGSGCSWTATSLVPWITIMNGSGMGDGAITFTVAPNSGGARTGQILHTDDSFYTITQAAAAASSTLRFGSATYNFGEGAGRATVTVLREGDAAGVVTVDFATVDDGAAVRCDTANGTAYARCDYSTTTNTVRFNDGDSAPKTITIPLIDDDHVEGSETVQLRLSNPLGATLGTPNTATLTITDNDPADGSGNPINTTPFFVRQHYLDFLAREPEAGEPWSAILNNCPNPFNTDPRSASASCDRILVSSAFFGSPEFRLKGFYVFTFYRVAFARLAEYAEIIVDINSVTGQTQQEVFQRRANFPVGFTQRQAFRDRYDALSNRAFVDALLNPYALQRITTPNPSDPEGGQKVVLTRDDLTNRLDGIGVPLTRAQVLRAIVESDEVSAAEFTRAFVATQYYGYLRRTPETAGFQAWLNYLSANPTDARTMVNGFLNSVEYRLRFGQP